MKKLLKIALFALLTATKCGFLGGMEKTLMPVILRVQQPERMLRMALDEAISTKDFKKCIYAVGLLTEKNISKVDPNILIDIIRIATSQYGGKVIAQKIAQCLTPIISSYAPPLNGYVVVSDDHEKYNLLCELVCYDEQQFVPYIPETKMVKSIIQAIRSRSTYEMRKVSCFITQENFTSTSFTDLWIELIHGAYNPNPLNTKDCFLHRLISYINKDNFHKVHSNLISGIIRIQSSLCQQLASYITQQNHTALDPYVLSYIIIRNTTSSLAHNIIAWNITSNFKNINQYVKAAIFDRCEKEFAQQCITKYVTKDNLTAFASQDLDSLIEKGGSGAANHVAAYITRENLATFPYVLLERVAKHVSPKTAFKLYTMALDIVSPLEKNLLQLMQRYPILDVTLLLNNKYDEQFAKSPNRNAMILCIYLDPVIKKLSPHYRGPIHEYKSHTKTPSRQHFQKHHNDSRETYSQIGPTVGAMLSNMHYKEVKAQEAGKYTFYHAEQSRWLAKRIIWKKLLEIMSGVQLPETYYPLRFELPGTYLSDQERDSILQTGRNDSNRPHLLFMNDKIFGNSKNRSSCSIEYFLHNHDMSSINPNTESLFKKCKLDDVYRQFSYELGLLEQETQSRKHGTFLQLIFTPELIKKAVYFCVPGGYRYHDNYGSNPTKITVTIDGKATDDVVEILNALRHTTDKVSTQSCGSCDTTEYCAVLSDGPEGLLNPFAKDPLEIRHYTAEDLRDWYKKVDTLFEKIKWTIAQDPKTVEMLKGFRKQHAQEIETFRMNHQPKSRL